jgi:uncharacterized protein YjiS (DUF1127 family)
MIARTANGYRQQSASATSAGLGMVLATIHSLAERAGWALWRWYQVRQTTRRLSALSDHMLTDIGLSRPTLISATLRRVHEEEAIRRGAWY